MHYPSNPTSHSGDSVVTGSNLLNEGLLVKISAGSLPMTEAHYLKLLPERCNIPGN